jgi:hypothetical protein
MDEITCDQVLEFWMRVLCSVPITRKTGRRPPEILFISSILDGNYECNTY